jgi:hypothetical protein
MKKLFAMVGVAVTLAVLIPLAPGQDVPVVPRVKLPAKDDVPQYLQDISVTIKAGNSSGSGVVTNINGDVFVLTCGHVVKSLRSSRSVEETDGRSKTVIDWDDAEIVKELVEDGRLVGQTRMQALMTTAAKSRGTCQPMRFPMPKNSPATGTQARQQRLRCRHERCRYTIAFYFLRN